MPPICVLCWFDVEDTVVPETDDAPLRIADIFARRGLRATFKIVGEKLRLLEERGRADVLEALRSHDVGYHSNRHSYHPTPVEYLQEMDWSEGVAEFMRREEQGVNDIQRLFAQPPACYGHPGGAWVPQAYGAMRHWGIPAYVSAGSLVSMMGKPFYFCGLFTVSRMQPNQISIGFDIDQTSGLEKLNENFLECYTSLRAEGGGLISVGAHAAQWILDGEFTDALNLVGGCNTPRAAWHLPPLKSPERREAGYRHLEQFLDFALTFEDVRFLGVREVVETYADRALDADIEMTELLLIAASVTEGITYQPTGAGFLSASEIFYLTSKAIVGYGGSRELPSAVRPRPLLGPTRSTKTTLKHPAVSMEGFLAAAADALEYAEYYQRVPSEIHLMGGVIPPEDYLATAAALLTQLAVKKEPLEVEVRRGTLRCADHASEQYANAAWRWAMLPAGFSAPKLLELARLQTWSIKPATLR